MELGLSLTILMSVLSISRCVFSYDNSFINAGYETCFINGGKSKVWSVHHVDPLQLKTTFKFQIT